MTGDMPTQYDPKQTEDRIYSFWEKEGCFSSTPNPEKTPCTIVIPPPNVTGVLHMGHALNNTLQDIVIRFMRMRGREALWIPGTDHAGVATQAVVEKNLWNNERKTRHDIGREELLSRIWKWKEKHGDTIIEQLKKLGCSCDWSRTRFTMDKGLSKAVRTVFVTLYKKGLIYRGERLVNWSCGLQTALSNDELEYEEIDGGWWYIKYPVEGEAGRYVTIATTRPETMLGDTAVAVHPDDERYNDLAGKRVILPLLDRPIPVIADEYVKMDEGTGCLKVTPAHDFNDFEIGNRHNLERINILNKDGTLNENAGPYKGLDRFIARDKVVEDLKKLKLLENFEPMKHNVAHCYRTHQPIEPMLSKQWFVKMKPLVELARNAEKNKKVEFHPERWSKTFHQWLDSTPDWCISRQIWWGHRIPVWTCNACGREICELDDPLSCPSCGSNDLEQDPDVLDTWFSSQLWPFSTLGWPEKTPDLDYYYPTELLVTDRGIIALWVARMIMMGEYFMGKEPFRHVYIHGTILDKNGERMSKSKGNGIDPLVMIRGGTDIQGKSWDGFGADAVRFTLATMTTEGQDLRIWPERFEAGRNFTNKVWNAARFCLMKLDSGAGIAQILEPGDLAFEDKWILSRLARTIDKMTLEFESFKFCDAAHTIYDFTWNEFCAWYVELTKFRLRKEVSESEDARVARRVLVYVLDRVLRLLHPVGSFITEEIWGLLNKRAPKRELLGDLDNAPIEPPAIIRASWPQPLPEFVDNDTERSMQVAMEAIRAVRNVRSRTGLAPAKRIQAIITCENKDTYKIVEERLDLIKAMAAADIENVGVGLERPRQSAVEVCTQMTVFVPLLGIIDLDAERKKLESALEKALSILERSKKKLGNPNFTGKAPAEIVEKEHRILAEAEAEATKIKDNLKDLS
ncbi:MAG: valine--tRNA ligase [Deltaproteobacteria bacterium]|nr:valine--tRNA ligase [Deltaproteobacteria bacterium]